MGGSAGDPKDSSESPARGDVSAVGDGMLWSLAEALWVKRRAREAEFHQGPACPVSRPSSDFFCSLSGRDAAFATAFPL